VICAFVELLATGPNFEVLLAKRRAGLLVLPWDFAGKKKEMKKEKKGKKKKKKKTKTKQKQVEQNGGARDLRIFLEDFLFYESRP